MKRITAFKEKQFFRLPHMDDDNLKYPSHFGHSKTELSKPSHGN